MRSPSQKAGESPAARTSYLPEDPSQYRATTPKKKPGSGPKVSAPGLLAGLPLPTPGDSFASLQTTVYLEAQKLANHTDHLQQVLSANEYRKALTLIPGIIQTMRDLNFHLHQVEGMLDAGKGKGGRNVR